MFAVAALVILGALVVLMAAIGRKSLAMGAGQGCRDARAEYMRERLQ